MDENGAAGRAVDGEAGRDEVSAGDSGDGKVLAGDSRGGGAVTGEEGAAGNGVRRGRERVAADAAARGLEVEFVERMRARSLEEAASLLGITPGDVIKSLVVKRSDGTFLFALIPGDRQISWPKLRAIVGVNKLQLPDPAVALDATGYERGTITPLGSTTPWPVYADAALVASPGRRVSMGAGEHGYSLFVEARALVEALAATVADISEPTPPR